MATRKKRTTTKKSVKETSYKVTKTRSDAGATDDNNEVIDAKNSAEAAEKAMKNDPRAGRYDKVEIEKDVGGSSKVRTIPDTVSKVKPKTQGMGQLESVKFPYNVALPMGFKALFDALPNKVTENLVYGSRYGKLHIQVPDATTLASLISETEKKARGKTDLKEMASLVANGINESVNK